MDERIRELERRAATGDEDARIRLGQLKCKTEGCRPTGIKNAVVSFDEMHCTNNVTITNNESQDIQLTFELTIEYNWILYQLRRVAIEFSKCPRCDKKDIKVAAGHLETIKSLLTWPCHKRV